MLLYYFMYFYCVSLVLIVHVEVHLVLDSMGTSISISIPVRIRAPIRIYTRNIIIDACNGTGSSMIIGNPCPSSIDMFVCFSTVNISSKNTLFWWDAFLCFAMHNLRHVSRHLDPKQYLKFCEVIGSPVCFFRCGFLEIQLVPIFFVFCAKHTNIV